MKFEDNIFLIGFMGAGKSTVAKELERKLGVKRVEMDQRIVDGCRMTIPDIFDKYGETYFRNLESNCLIELQHEKPCIVSCGGGVVTRDENVRYMKESGRIVLLTATPATILERVKDNDDRPLLRGNMNVEYIGGLMGKRREKYFAAADIVVATDGKTVGGICGEIVQGLEKIGDRVKRHESID